MNTKTQKPAKGTTRKASKGFTAEERAAMRARAKELKSASGESDLLAKVAEMPTSDRAMAERIHEIITATAPELSPRTWYGMPAYARDDKVVCFFKCAAKFKTRYATLGFSDKANLDDGAMWPTEFALKKLTAADEKRIAALVKKAVS
jgi:uncharacterized protein YdhG (YjbR/CyaY superfamily)